MEFLLLPSRPFPVTFALLPVAPFLVFVLFFFPYWLFFPTRTLADSSRSMYTRATLVTNDYFVIAIIIDLPEMLARS
jgi:hypothetical protein